MTRAERRRTVYVLDGAGVAHRAASKLRLVTRETWCGRLAKGYVSVADVKGYRAPKCPDCFAKEGA